MHRVVDYLMPRNCRKELALAASQNAAACLEAVCLLKQHNVKTEAHHAVEKAYAAK